MSQIFILGEGPTELAFVETILSPFLAPKLHVIPKLHKLGGGLKYNDIIKDLKLWLRNPVLTAATMLCDFYKFPKPPSYRPMPSWDGYRRVMELEEILFNEIADDRFIPFLMLHEFESLILVDPDKIAAQVKADRKPFEALSKTVKKSKSPEEINKDSPPSHRIMQAFPQYTKVNDGIAIAQNIGLPSMRAACPHFNEWLLKLERL